MRAATISAIRHAVQDRSVIVVFSILLITCIAAAVYFGIRVQPSYNQVYTHYTSYGGVNLYASQWWYALSFVFFFVFVALVHTAIGVKLHATKSAQLARGFGWFSIGLVVFATIMLTNIVNVAFPL